MEDADLKRWDRRVVVVTLKSGEQLTGLFMASREDGLFNIGSAPSRAGVIEGGVLVDIRGTEITEISMA